MANQLPPPQSARSATTHSDPLSLPQSTSRLLQSGPATAHSSRTDPDPEPPVSDDPNHSEPLSLQRRTSRLHRSGEAAAHPPEQPWKGRLRHPRRSGADASAADPDPEPSVSDSDDPTYSKPSSVPPGNSLVHCSHRSGSAASAANPDPEQPVSDDDSCSKADDPNYSEPQSQPRKNSRSRTSVAVAGHPPKSPTNSRLCRSRLSGAAAAAADPDPEPPVKWVKDRRTGCSASASERVSLLNHENSEFPNEDELVAAELLLPLKERANLPAENQSSKKPGKAEEEVRDQVNDVQSSVDAKWKLAEDDKNSKEDEGPCKAPAVDADWEVKQTRSGDARIQNMIKLEFDKFSSKLHQLSKDIEDIKRILLTRDMKEN